MYRALTNAQSGPLAIGRIACRSHRIVVEEQLRFRFYFAFGILDGRAQQRNKTLLSFGRIQSQRQYQFQKKILHLIGHRHMDSRDDKNRIKSPYESAQWSLAHDNAILLMLIGAVQAGQYE